MKKIIIAGLVVVGLMLGGCALPTGKQESAETKLQQNVVTKSGELKMKSGDEYLLSTDEGIVNITSNKVNLDNYLKKKIEVTGMFSGSTLYVDEIKER